MAQGRALSLGRRVLSDCQELKIVKQYLAGSSLEQLSERYHVSSGPIIYALKKSGVERRHRHRSKIVNDDAFVDAELSEIASYFVGYLMADGHVHIRGGSAYLGATVAFEDRPQLEKLRRFLGSTHAISCGKKSEREFNGRVIKSGPYCKLQIPSQKLVADLAMYGIIPRKSLVAKASEGMASNRHFWRGVIDGDGFVAIHTIGQWKGVYPVIALCGSKALLDQFATFVKSFCACVAKVGKAGPNHFQFRTSGKSAVAIVERLYRDCAIALPRKLRIANQIIMGNW